MDSTLIWYTARASGIVAWALLAASALWGLAMSTKLFRRRPRPNWMLDLHRFLGGTAVVFLAVHVTSILLDSYVHFGIVEVLVPLTGNWHPGAVAWGISAMYLLVAVEVTSLLRSRIPKRVWRSTHYAAFPLFAFATVHGLTAGTDRHTWGLELAFYGVGAIVALATIARILLSVARGRRQPERPVGRGAAPRPPAPADRRLAAVPAASHTGGVRAVG